MKTEITVKIAKLEVLDSVLEKIDEIRVTLNDNVRFYNEQIERAVRRGNTGAYWNDCIKKTTCKLEALDEIQDYINKLI